MNLNKFLRKNSRILLMVFMSFLLVAFLVPTQVQGCGDRARSANPKWGEAFGQDIRNSDLELARAEMRVVQRFPRRFPLPANLTALDYLLLTKEAQQAGVCVGRDEMKDTLVRTGVSNAALQSVQRNTRLSYDHIYDALGRWMAVLRLVNMQAGATGESLPRLEQNYRDENQHAQTKISVVDAKAFVDLVPEPTDQQLQAFFDECKARNQAHTDEELVFGYRLPDRVAIEYLTVDPEQVKRKVSIRASQVEEFFKDNQRRYMKPDPTATQPVPGQPPAQVPMTYEEARQQVRDDFRTQRAIEEAQRLVNEMYDEADRQWRSAERGEDGFNEPPADVEFVSFEELKARQSERFELVYGRTELLDRLGIWNVPGLGRAGLGPRQSRVAVYDLALRVKGILEQAPDDNQPVLNVMEPGPVVVGPDATFRNPSYQAYLFRVVEIAPSAPPETLDEVRQQVIDDWKSAQAFALARERAQQLAARARDIGLETAVEQATELKDTLTKAEQAATQPASQPSTEPSPPVRNPRYANALEPYTPAKLTRRSTSMPPRIARNETIAPAIFELAAGTVAQDEHRVACLPLAQYARWVVVEFVELKPVYTGAFEQQLAQSAATSRQQVLERFITEWLDPESIAKRTGFQDARTLSATP